MYYGSGYISHGNVFALGLVSGARYLVTGPMLTAGIGKGEADGLIICPRLDTILFLPERPYLPPGTLRDVLVTTGRKRAIGERIGGRDVERDWDDVLSLAEQRLFCVARVLLTAPRFVVLERPRDALEVAHADRVLGLLRERSTTYLHARR